MLKGTNHTLETKIKLAEISRKPPLLIRCAFCGNDFNVRGKNHSAKYCSLNCMWRSGTRRGTHQSEETKIRIGKSVSAKFNTPEYREKLSKAHMGHSTSQSTRKKLSLLKTGVNHHNWGKNITWETKQKISKALKGKPGTRGTLGMVFSSEWRTKISDAKRRQWNNPVLKDKFIKSIFSAINKRPNHIERKLGIILDNNYLEEYEYNGNGKVVIGGLVPDYINKNGRKEVIELFGNYWHRNDNPQDRINKFAKRGYKCLVIWEWELENSTILIEKINRWRNYEF